MLPNGKDGDWVWEHRQDATVAVPGKFICQINPEIIEIGTMIRRGAKGERDEETLRKAVGYGFCSDELRDLAGMIFRSLSPEDHRRMVEIKQTDHFPYQIDSELDGHAIANHCC